MEMLVRGGMWRSVLFLLLVAASMNEGYTPVRVTFLTDCTTYSHWMSLGLQFSFKMSQQPGKLTRVACCTDDERNSYSDAYKTSVNTFLAPSFAIHPRTGDDYPPYNKPEAVISYLEHTTPEEEYMLVLDSDMILRRPFLVEEMKPKLGLAIGARYTYMMGVKNELAIRHVSEIAPRNDSLAGPSGRRGDQVGGFFFMHRDDMKKMSKLWLKYTEDVRADEMAWKYSGDVYATKPGDDVWISEMYGYSFGAAKADVWHKWSTYSMIYPEYIPAGIPKLMHFGLDFKIEFSLPNGSTHFYKFAKQDHYKFDPLKCPSWDLSAKESEFRSHGLFPHIPVITSIVTSKGQNVMEYYRDLLSLETVATINAGLCDFHLVHCPPSQQLLDECSTAWERYLEVAAESRRVEGRLECVDFDDVCAPRAAQGDCDHFPDMEDKCPFTCKICTPPVDKPDLPPKNNEMAKKLKKLRESLRYRDLTQDTTSASPVLASGDTAAARVEEGLQEKQILRADHGVDPGTKEAQKMQNVSDAGDGERSGDTAAARVEEGFQEKLILNADHGVDPATKEAQKMQSVADTGGGGGSGDTAATTVEEGLQEKLLLSADHGVDPATKEAEKMQADAGGGGSIHTTSPPPLSPSPPPPLPPSPDPPPPLPSPTPPPSPPPPKQPDLPPSWPLTPSPPPSPPRSKLSRQAMMLQCYRLELTIDEVKVCVKAAKGGFEFIATHPVHFKPSEYPSLVQVQASPVVGHVEHEQELRALVGQDLEHEQEPLSSVNKEIDTRPVAKNHLKLLLMALAFCFVFVLVYRRLASRPRPKTRGRKL